MVLFIDIGNVQPLFNSMRRNWYLVLLVEMEAIVRQLPSHEPSTSLVKSSGLSEKRVCTWCDMVRK